MTIIRTEKPTHISIFIDDPNESPGQGIYFTHKPKGSDPFGTGALKVIGIGMQAADIAYWANKQGLTTFPKTDIYTSVIFPHEELPLLLDDLKYIKQKAPKEYMKEFAEEMIIMTEEAINSGGYIIEDGI